MKSSSKFPICYLTPEEIQRVRKQKKAFIRERQITFEEYHNINDSVTSIERIRSFQLVDVLGRYKLF